MWRDKPPGLKILWVWTLGTAAVLVANVVGTRIKDMDNLINNTQEHQQQNDTLLVPESTDQGRQVLVARYTPSFVSDTQH